MFPIGCRCLYGSATADVFEKGIYLIWIRLLVGLALGEDRKKTLIYIVMPFVVGLVVSTIGPIIWPHAH
jgi:Na+/citrate or Na+/malate symporter